MIEGFAWSALILGIIGYLFGDPLWNLCKGWWDEYRKNRMFKVSFVDRPPPEERQVVGWRKPYPIPVGDSEHLLQVVCNSPLQLNVFDIRFLNLDEVVADGTEPPHNIGHIIKIYEVHLMPEVGLQGIHGRMIDDEMGGIKIVIEGKPWDIAAKEPFTLRLRVRASMDAWTGKISFRAPVEGIRRRVRCSVVVSAAEATRKFIFTVPGATPTCVVDVVDH